MQIRFTQRKNPATAWVVSTCGVLLSAQVFAQPATEATIPTPNSTASVASSETDSVTSPPAQSAAPTEAAAAPSPTPSQNTDATPSAIVAAPTSAPSPTAAVNSTPEVAPERPFRPIGRRKLGIGIQAAPFPLFGPSVIYSPVDAIGLEVLGEAFIDIDWIGARALLRPFSRPGHRFYFSGLVGHFVDSKFSTDVFSPVKTETAFGYGAGLGIAFFFKRQSSFELNLELDYVHIDFSPSWKYDYGAVNLIMAGAGFHYYVL